MTAPKFTRGGWETGGESDPFSILSTSSYFQMAAVNEVIEEAAANAHLIAAAPELYEGFAMALSQMETAADCVEAGRLDEALLHLRSLRHKHLAHLAKARGEQ